MVSPAELIVHLENGKSYGELRECLAGRGLESRFLDVLRIAMVNVREYDCKSCIVTSLMNSGLVSYVYDPSSGKQIYRKK